MLLCSKVTESGLSNLWSLELDVERNLNRSCFAFGAAVSIDVQVVRTLGMIS